MVCAGRFCINIPLLGAMSGHSVPSLLLCSLFFARLSSCLLVLVLLVTLIPADRYGILATNISSLGSCSLGYTSGEVTVSNSGDLALLVLLGI